MFAQSWKIDRDATMRQLTRRRLWNLERLTSGLASTLRPVQLWGPYRDHVGTGWRNPRGYGIAQIATPRLARESSGGQLR